MSGGVWAVATVAYWLAGLNVGFAVLFFGGMAIFPLGVLMATLVYGKVDPVPGNPGGRLVSETVPAMVLVLGLAWLLIPLRPDWAFPVAAVAVGAHYFPFRTAYGDWLYWVLAAVMCAVGCAAIFAGVPSGVGVPLAIAVIEVVFGVVLTMRSRREFAVVRA